LRNVRLKKARQKKFIKFNLCSELENLLK
jgi:hypothetical protein